MLNRLYPGWVHEVTGVNEVNGPDYVGKIPGHTEGLNCQTGGIIIWGENNYEIDEFRSLVNGRLRRSYEENEWAQE